MGENNYKTKCRITHKNAQVELRTIASFLN